MKKYIFLILICSSLFAMKKNDNNQDYSFLIGSAGSDHFSRKAEKEFLRRQQVELEHLFYCKQERETNPRKRTRTYEK